MERHHLWLLSTMAAATALVLAGCGAGSSASASGPAASTPAASINSASAAAYRKGIDAQCASATAFNRALPALSQRKHLSEDEIQAQINQDGARMRSGIAATTPPAELASAHQKLVADLTRLQATSSEPLSAATLTTRIEAATALLSDYERVGASGCAAGEQGAIKLFQAASRTLNSTPTPG